MRIHTVVLAAACVTLSAASLAAQAPAIDSTKMGRLTTVTVTAERSGNRFTRAAEMRDGVLFLIEENRRLARELRLTDARVATLTTRLDSLQQVEAVRLRALAVTTDSISAVRARRAALEARIVALETPGTPR